MTKIIAGINDLTTTNPELMKDWDYIKNTDVDPHTVSFGSKKKVWWKCNKGHEYLATISHRTHGTGCPFCTNRSVLSGFNDLATIRPDLVNEWDYEKNDINPTEVLSGSRKTVWWICPEGHSYQMPISLRTEGKCNCPVCGGKRVEKGVNDFASIHPEYLVNWNYNKNSVTPDSVTVKSHKKIWWKCSKCGHEWLAPVSRISAGGGCPNCRRIIVGNKRSNAHYEKSIAFNYPELLKEWDYNKNIDLDPEKIYVNSNKNSII